MAISVSSTSLGPNTSSLEPDKRETADRRLQAVFTAVLQQSGRAGYASAEPLPTGTDLPTQIHDSWHEWFSEVRGVVYASPAGPGNPSVQVGKTATEVGSEYQSILLDAYQRGGYAEPQQYLQSLSADQLKTVQQIHHLAEPIQPAGLSTEASLNLLLPPAAVVDADHNGLAEVGAARLLGFPNSDTPRNVRDAWHAATAGLSEQEVAIHQLQMLLPLFTANMKFDQDGQFVRSVEPGDPDWVNPMNSDQYSFQQAAQGWLDYLERFRYQMSPERYQNDRTFWSTFARML